jgi:hypothetical protein
VEINGFGMVYRRPANDQHDQHEYVCVKSIVSNVNDINAQTTTTEETSNSQAAVESNESDDITIESYIGPSSKGPGKGVKMLNFINTLLIK